VGRRHHLLGNGATMRLLSTRATLQAKLTVNQPGDPFEREADAIADRVMRMPDPAVQRACACGGGAAGDQPCAECARERDEDEPPLRRVAAPGPAPPAHAPPAVREVLRRPGRPLDPAERAFMEPRLGRDLGAVRIHADDAAAASAAGVRALAYTVRSHVVFGAGRYRPGDAEGRRLLAHELVHVLQQDAPGEDAVLRRTPDPAVLAEFDQRATAIRAHPAFRGVGAAGRAIAGEILRLARTRDNALYYVDYLERLFNTPDAPSTTVAAAGRQETAEAAARERERLATVEGQLLEQIEEEATAEPRRRWVRRRGAGAFYQVDATSPAHIVVRAKVRLVRRGPGTAADVANVLSLEDAIEKWSRTAGYTLDLEFTTRGGADVFTVQVDPSGWTTSGNWVGDPHGLAHELHHLLGLDDRYNYIEAHAANASMVMTDRLHWFREQLRRDIRQGPDPQGSRSIMGGGRQPLDDDVCRVAGLSLASCVPRRQAERARLSAFVSCHRVVETLHGVRPTAPAPFAAERERYGRAELEIKARTILGSDVRMGYVSGTVDRMRTLLSPSLVIVAPARDPECAGRETYARNGRPPLRLCPAFFSVPEANQPRVLLRHVAHLVGASDLTPCPGDPCGPCAGPERADGWARFVECAR
jgi:hypothetical protein